MTWGCLFVREMARHRVRRVCYIGAGARPRGVQQQQPQRSAWQVRDPLRFAEYSARRLTLAGGPVRGAHAGD